MQRPAISILLFFTIIGLAVTGMAEYISIPDSIRTELEKETGPLGRSLWQVEQLRPAPYTLPAVRSMFEDIENPQRFSASLSDRLIANVDKPGAISRLCWSYLDALAGEGDDLTQGDGWGIDLAMPSDSPDEWLRIMANDAKNGNSLFNNYALQEWMTLPEPLQLLVFRIYLAARFAEPYLDEALPFIDSNLLPSNRQLDVNEFGNYVGNPWNGDRIYRFLSAPWKSDQPDRDPFRQMELVDKSYLAYASNSFILNVDRALEEFRGTKVDYDTTMEFGTPYGRVVISGNGDDTHSGEAFLTIDLGGDDTWGEGTALGIDGISVVIDIDGNDGYKVSNPGLGVGIYGIGLLIDMSGSDSYEGNETVIGVGLYGTGMVWDRAGDDTYTSDSLWGQGAAHLGVGMLIDNGGNDRYTCWSEAQGFGGTEGFGLLLDMAGNDIYAAPKQGRHSDAFGMSISLCQGAGFGRRADGWDGHSFAGGIGVLVDGQGDDSYTGQVYCQGTGYWWSMGILNDVSGNDTYNCAWYSLGSAPHFAIGSMTDRSGDDRYNVGNPDAKCQYQACARDGSLGVFEDLDGDDRYLFKNRCAGAADLNSIALFWDRRGDDTYDFDPESPYPDDPAMGSATFYEPFGSARDDIPTIGVFLDSGGEDTYQGDGPANNTHWSRHRGEIFRAIGLDIAE